MRLHVNTLCTVIAKAWAIMSSEGSAVTVAVSGHGDRCYGQRLNVVTAEQRDFLKINL